MMTLSVQWLLAACSILGSIGGAYLGVKVAVARTEEQIKALANSIRHLEDRVERLEAPHFSPR